MAARYVLSPRAAKDLIQIWKYVRDSSSVTVADRVEEAIRRQLDFLSAAPGAGHVRTDLTDRKVKFSSVYSYLIVYKPDTKPLSIVSILHGKRDIPKILKSE